MPTPKEVAAAWHSVEGFWGIKHDKWAEDGLQWSAVHDPEHMKDVISGIPIVVFGRFATREAAAECIKAAEDEARGSAVLALFGKRER
jgi:hypothetical protein